MTHARSRFAQREADLTITAELFSLAGRKALVTGARHGIGRELAFAFARAGASVALTSRRSSDLSEIARELSAFGVGHHEIELELRSEKSVIEAVAAAAGQLGGLDIVVNNAGLAVRSPALDHSVADWDAVLETNLRGTFLICRESVAAMVDGGSIINLSSTFARSAHRDRVAYGASKAGVEQLTRMLALEWAARDIRVNAIAPTVIETETRRDLFANEQVRMDRIRSIPMGRLGETRDVVGVALLLASPAGRFITGQTIVVDGGETL